MKHALFYLSLCGGSSRGLLAASSELLIMIGNSSSVDPLLLGLLNILLSNELADDDLVNSFRGDERSLGVTAWGVMTLSIGVMMI